MRSKNKKLQEKQQTEILYALPGFLNQLLLLTGSGMVLADALQRIADGYELLPQKEKNYFTESFVKLRQDTARTGESLLTAFRRFSRFSHVKELNRVTGILEENQSKGSALWEKLQEQSEALWTARKQITLARIRMAESKMSFPLGIFLIAKIIEYLFNNFPTHTYAAIIGLILSSPFAILYSADALAVVRPVELVVGILLALLGAWVTWLMGSKEQN